MIDLADRLERLPMHLAQQAIIAMTDPRVDTVPAFRLMATFLLHADPETLIVGPDSQGRPLSEPTIAAEVSGVAKSTGFRTFKLLEDAGYIEWVRTKRAGTVKTPGSLRLILRHHAAA